MALHITLPKITHVPASVNNLSRILSRDYDWHYDHTVPYTLCSCNTFSTVCLFSTWLLYCNVHKYQANKYSSLQTHIQANWRKTVNMHERMEMLEVMHMDALMCGSVHRSVPHLSLFISSFPIPTTLQIEN